MGHQVRSSIVSWLLSPSTEAWQSQSRWSCVVVLVVACWTSGASRVSFMHSVWWQGSVLPLQGSGSALPYHMTSFPDENCGSLWLSLQVSSPTPQFMSKRLCSVLVRRRTSVAPTADSSSCQPYVCSLSCPLLSCPLPVHMNMLPSGILQALTSHGGGQ